MRVIQGQFFAILLVLVGPAAQRPADALAQRAESPGACHQPLSDAVTHVGLDAQPTLFAVTRDGCWIFVRTQAARNIDERIVVLHRRSDRVQQTRTISLKGPSHSLALTHDDQLLLIVNEQHVFFADVQKLISGNDDFILGRIRDRHFGGPDGLIVSPDDRYAFVTQMNTAWISIIDIDKARRTGFGNDAIVGGVPLELSPSPGPILSPDGKSLYVFALELSGDRGPISCTHAQTWLPPRSREGGVVVIDVQRAISGSSSAIVSSFSAGCGPAELAISPDGNTLYVRGIDLQTIVAYDMRPVRAGGAPVMLGNLPDQGSFALIEGGKTIVAGGRGRSSRIIDTVKFASGTDPVVGTIAAVLEGRQISLSADGSTLIGVNVGMRTLVIVDPRRAMLPR